MKINIGVRVQILPYAEYRNKYCGECGTIERYNQFGSQQTIGIRLDNYLNKASGYGVFWFDKEKIKVINEEGEKTMLKGFTVVGISFIEGKNTNAVYSYALYDEIIKESDIVVVKTGHHGFALAKVVSIGGELTAEDISCNREIVTKVDFSDYNARREKEQKIYALKKEMDVKVRKLQNYAIYELLAEKDPSLKKMLEEFKALCNED